MSQKEVSLNERKEETASQTSIHSTNDNRSRTVVPHLPKMTSAECRQLAEDLALFKSGLLPRVPVEWLKDEDAVEHAAV